MCAALWILIVVLLVSSFIFAVLVSNKTFIIYLAILLFFYLAIRKISGEDWEDIIENGNVTIGGGNIVSIDSDDMDFESDRSGVRINGVYVNCDKCGSRAVNVIINSDKRKVRCSKC